METLGARLKEERVRLGMTQDGFGALLDVQKSAQSKYENDLLSPSPEYLAGLVAVGVDVLYVLTGQRSGDVPKLSQREASILDNLRHCDEEDQRAIERMALTSAKAKQAETGKVRRTGSARKVA
ncbi:Transcriptional regulator [Gammaproteobacteria bacterium]